MYILFIICIKGSLQKKSLIFVIPPLTQNIFYLFFDIFFCSSLNLMDKDLYFIISLLLGYKFYSLRFFIINFNFNNTVIYTLHLICIYRHIENG